MGTTAYHRIFGEQIAHWPLVVLLLWSTGILATITFVVLVSTRASPSSPAVERGVERLLRLFMAASPLSGILGTTVAIRAGYGKFTGQPDAAQIMPVLGTALDTTWLGLCLALICLWAIPTSKLLLRRAARPAEEVRHG